MSVSLTKAIKVLAMMVVFALSFTTQIASALEVGDQAPDFSLHASDGNTYTLSQFKGKEPVVIAFFPKAFTGG